MRALFSERVNVLRLMVKMQATLSRFFSCEPSSSELDSTSTDSAADTSTTSTSPFVVTSGPTCI